MLAPLLSLLLAPLLSLLLALLVWDLEVLRSSYTSGPFPHCCWACVCGDGVSCSEEREKHHKALALELKKLKAEVKDICKHFDDTVFALFQKSLKVVTYIKAQELYTIRLSIAVQDREDAFLRDREVEDKQETLIVAENEAQDSYEAFVATVDAQEKAVAELQVRPWVVFLLRVV